MKSHKTMNLFMASFCLINVLFQCFLAVENIQHIVGAAGYTVALLMCGIIEVKNQQIYDLTGGRK